MSWAAWLMLLSPLILVILLTIWLKITEYQIDKQYKDRQDDE